MKQLVNQGLVRMCQRLDLGKTLNQILLDLVVAKLDWDSKSVIDLVNMQCQDHGLEAIHQALVSEQELR